MATKAQEVSSTAHDTLAQKTKDGVRHVDRTATHLIPTLGNERTQWLYF